MSSNLENSLLNSGISPELQRMIDVASEAGSINNPDDELDLESEEGEVTDAVVSPGSDFAHNAGIADYDRLGYYRKRMYNLEVRFSMDTFTT
jgi:hypothetical protein